MGKKNFFTSYYGDKFLCVEELLKISLRMVLRMVSGKIKHDIVKASEFVKY